MEQMKIVYTLIYTIQSDKTSDWRDRDRSNNGKQFLKGWNGNGSSGIRKSFQRNHWHFGFPATQKNLPCGAERRK